MSAHRPKIKRSARHRARLKARVRRKKKLCQQGKRSGGRWR